MRLKKSIKKATKKFIKSFKRLLMWALPRQTIEILKKIERKVISFNKRALYSIYNQTKSILWRKGSVVFNGSEYNSHPFTITKNKSKTFVFSNLMAGEYEITVYHNDKYLHSRRNSFYVSFDLTTNGYFSMPLSKVDFSKRESKTNLPFEYLGNGRYFDAFYKQTVKINLAEDIELLKAKFKTQFDRQININEIVLTDVSPLVLNDDVCSRLKELPPSVLVYGDININTIDGSSIWLSSLVNILSRFTHVILLSKDNLKTEKSILNNINTENFTVIYPESFRQFREFSLENAFSALKIIDSECPIITGLVTRGVELALEVQKDKSFMERRFVYITDFYTPKVNYYELKYTPETLEQLLYNTDYLLYQTEEIQKALSEFSLTNSNLPKIHLPPTVDVLKCNDDFENENQTNGNGAIKIGYAGKIQPNWGVLELIEEVKNLVSEGVAIELHIASGKISEGDGSQPGFKQEINQFIKKEDFITFYQSLSRTECQKLMSDMDYVWCYRPAQFENATLEVSTKLIEAVAEGQRAITYPSEINIKLLGDNYPFFIKEAHQVHELLKSKVEYGDTNLRDEMSTKYSFDSVASSIKSFFKSYPTISQNVLFAGNDFKFIYPLISHLKKAGTPVLIDPWAWGECNDLDASKQKKDWADIIFCEWGLANAAWYSNNNEDQKPLFIRIHAQEVRPKARKFATNINVNNVTKLIFVSETIRDKAIDLFSWPIEKTVVIPNFVEEIPFQKKDMDEEIRLGMVGIVPQTKRLDRAIDLLERLLEDDRNASLHIKGHRPEAIEFMHAPGRVKELDYYYALYSRIDSNPLLKNNIHFYEWGNDVALWYRNINVILSPSDNESFHYALADGVMAGAKPVVWPWEGADKVYPSHWIIDETLEGAIDLINSNQKSEAQENKQFLKDKYGKALIFQKLIQLIKNEGAS